MKLEDIQAQALLGGRTIKLEELGVSVQNAGQSVSTASVTQVRNHISLTFLIAFLTTNQSIKFIHHIQHPFT